MDGEIGNTFPDWRRVGVSIVVLQIRMHCKLRSIGITGTDSLPAMFRTGCEALILLTFAVLHLARSGWTIASWKGSVEKEK